MKRILISAVFLGLFLTIGSAQAIIHESRQQTDILPVQEQGQTFQEESAKKREFSREELERRAREHHEAFESKRRMLQEETQARREEFQQRAEQIKREQLDEIERRKQEFREKVAQIREEHHRLLTERLQENINRANQHMSDAALRYLDALELVLGKIEARTRIVEDATGADLTSVRNEIARARQRIEETRSAVLAQKSKEYVISIQSQETLGQDIRQAMQELRDDHQRLRQETLRPLRTLIHDVMLMLRTAVQQAGNKGEEALHEEFIETKLLP